MTVNASCLNTAQVCGGKTYRLTYTLVAGYSPAEEAAGRVTYGVRADMYENGCEVRDSRTVADIFADEREAVIFLNRLADGTVFPEQLMDVALDYV